MKYFFGEGYVSGSQTTGPGKTDKTINATRSLIRNSGRVYKVRSQKQITGLFGNFSQMADPPPTPPFGNPLFKKKFYRLFCILDP